MLGQDHLKDMVAEIDQFDPELYPPKDKLEDNERVIGRLEDPWLKRLYAITTFYRREASKAGLECKLDDAEEGSDQRKEYSRLHMRHDTYAKMFWSSVRAHYNLYDISVGMRKDWNIVTWDSKDGDNPIKKLLDALE